MDATDDERKRLMRRCLDEAAQRTREGHGGPFAALVVRGGLVVATGFNQVTSLRDPTAHAEIQAIRRACEALGDFRLSGCDVYASCEPCPMCLGALNWARVRAIYHAASRWDAARAGFDDQALYEELARPAVERRIPMVQVLEDEGRRPFDAWLSKADRVPY